MRQIDFYNLPILSLNDDALLFICKLTHKIWQQNLNGYINCQDEQQRQQLDKLLWQYRADSFIPHSLLEEKLESPILLGMESMEYQGINYPILINLHNEPPKYYQQFERIIEFVVNNTDLKEQARVYYRFYKDAQCQVKYHTITNI